MVSYVFLILVVLFYGVSSEDGTFIGVSSATCTEIGCDRLYVALLDTQTGIARNVTLIPDAVLDNQHINLIHSVADPQTQLYYLTYSKIDIEGSEKTTIVTYNVSTAEFSVVDVDKKIKAIYSFCHSTGDEYLGLGWLPGDTVYTLSAFSISSDDWEVIDIVELPGLYDLIPDCSYNPVTQMLYFYFRTENGDTPAFTVWQIDVRSSTYQEWRLNTSIWAKPYLFQYDPTTQQMYALLANGLLQTVLAVFDPTNSYDPFTTIKVIPNQPLFASAVSYSRTTSQFVYISAENIIVSVGPRDTNTMPLKGLPDYAIKTLSFLK